MTEQSMMTLVANDDTARGAVKRRGLIAGAAALVAGIVVARTAEPVAASAAVLGQVNTETSATEIDANEQATLPNGTPYANRSPVIFGNASTLPDTVNFGAESGLPYTVDGIAGVGKGNYTGVVGTGGQANGTGVLGFGSGGVGITGGTGVIGVAMGAPNPPAGTVKAGVYGEGSGGNAPGVWGNAASFDGVHGVSISGKGVSGLSTSGTGVYGLIPGGSATGTIAISGTNNSSAANSHGIVGTAGSGHGLIGNTNFTGGGPPYYAGLIGNAPNGAYAGLFFGKVSITGTLNGHTAIMVHSQVAIAHPDGSHRLSYALSSTESMVEELGKGTLVNGQATVKIDPAFAALADLGDYHIFLTAYGDRRTLSVGKQTAEGFEVLATSGELSAGPAGAVQGSGKFGWRVVAKRKDGQAQRLATYTFPGIEPPKLPVPESAVKRAGDTPVSLPPPPNPRSAPQNVPKP